LAAFFVRADFAHGRRRRSTGDRTIGGFFVPRRFTLAGLSRF
jgi:hypothetical protein